MLTSTQAQQIVERWKDKFPSAEAVMTSYDRYEARIPAPNRSPDSFERWLSEDADQQHVRAAVMSKLDPSAGPSQALPVMLDDCAVCHGKRMVRRDLPIGHPEFGKALRCPACGGQPTGTLPAPEVAERLMCWKCGQFQDDWADEMCTNPKWHDLNWTSGKYPKERSVPGWRSVSETPLEPDATHEHFQRMWDAAMAERLKPQNGAGNA